MTHGKGFHCHSNHYQQLFKLKKQKKKSKNKQTRITKKLLHSIGLTLNCSLLTAAVAEKAV